MTCHLKRATEREMKEYSQWVRLDAADERSREVVTVYRGVS